MYVGSVVWRWEGGCRDLGIFYFAGSLHEVTGQYLNIQGYS